MKRIPVGILGVTGMVGQRLVVLLENHPWFVITKIAASRRSTGKTYKEAVKNRWFLSSELPKSISPMKILSVEDDIDEIVADTRVVFCALDMDKEEVKKLEEKYASKGCMVISNNSAHRWTPDVPMIIPEVNPQHVQLIDIQRKKRKWITGGIAVKSNCSIQSYVPVLHALRAYEPYKIIVTTQQAISGAGKTFTSWPEMQDNVIPFIDGEEDKSEKEPLKVWGEIRNEKLYIAKIPIISATCLRVAVSDGHMASVSVAFRKKATEQQLIDAIKKYKNPIAKLNLPSSPKVLFTYFADQDRPQIKLDRDLYHGMGISVGRIRKDAVLDWKFVALSHNTLRGAAGGAVLLAELLVVRKYIE